MLPGHANRLSPSCIASYWKNEFAFEVYPFINRTIIPFKHFFHLFLHSLSSEKVALELHSYYLYYGTYRVASCSDLAVSVVTTSRTS